MMICVSDEICGIAPRTIGERKRDATISGVKILSADRLLCNSLAGRRLYLVEISSGRIIDSIETTHRGEPTTTDVCDARGDRIITSNVDIGGLSLYGIDGDKLAHLRDLDVDLVLPHSARWYADDVVVAATMRRDPGAHFFEVSTGKHLLSIPTELRCKDIVFPRAGRAILLTSSSVPDGGTDTENRLVEVRFDLRRGRYSVQRQRTWRHGQIDSGVLHGGRLYVVDAARSLILVFESLRRVRTIRKYDLPHGIDIGHGWLAVTSFADHGVHVSAVR